MIGRLLRATLWLMGGSGATFAAYWAFLNTPESSAPMLALSAALALLAFGLAGITVNGVLLAWATRGSPGSLGRAIRGLSGFAIATSLVVALWWAVSSAVSAVDARHGEISAWFIARMGWADVRWLFAATAWIGIWLRAIVAPLISLSFLSALIGAERQAGDAARAVRRALSPLRLVRATCWGALLVAVPWVYLAPWRPRSLPASSIEPAFVAVKLIVVALVMATGAALVAREASLAAGVRPGDAAR